MLAVTPLLMRLPRVAVPVVVKAPTTVEEAWETKPLPCVSRPASVSAPVEENDDVAVPPKYAFENTERLDDEAFWNVCNPVQLLALVRLRESVAVPPRETGEPEMVRPPPFESVIEEFWSWLLPMVLVATTCPEPLTDKSELVSPVSVSWPALLNVDVAVPPKYAVPKLEKLVEEAALGKTTRFGRESVGVVPPEDVIWLVVPETEVT